MSVAELFNQGGLTLLGVLVAALAIGALAGAALGYFSASTDLQRERAKAWDEGAGITSRRNPYRKALAPAPPHVVIPSPDWQADAGGLFDQDAPSAAARAIELRGDD